MLSRTLFQIWWFLALVALLLVACRGHRRTVLLACALPLVLVLGVYAKNWLMYDVPSTTSWTGMGLARSAVVALPLSERRRLVAEGKLHGVSLVKPFSPLAAYIAVGIEPEPPRGIPLLDERAGPEYSRNVENRTYIEISRLYMKDDLWIIKHRPGAYLSSVGHGAADFFAAPTAAWEGAGNVGRMSRYDHWFDEVVYGRFTAEQGGPVPDRRICVRAPRGGVDHRPAVTPECRCSDGYRCLRRSDDPLCGRWSATSPRSARTTASGSFSTL